MKAVFILLLGIISVKSYTAMNDDIFHAARSGDLAIVKEVLSIDPKAIDRQDYKGYSPLILAVYNEQEEIVDYLLEQGASVSLKDNSGNSALMGASFKGYYALAEKLLKAGAEIDAANHNKATALTFASTFGHEDLVRLFISKGANPNLEDIRGMSPIDHAKAQGNMVIVELLSKNKAY
ncbi:ankyrin repeat domain-containing protein [Aureibacter tunicatorum]|uniref:Ankyrin repeat domain-containing protein n=1 Tax=Aureibacter tunicatorum TaxID=866807 RepID=A0AAE4BT57_9BACT|nr:ankyrin repeat domain-containing protein [Aureibacter tunicatorum]MDR6240446.1 hypothetical protein [Aureibacter tunicatorum]BDD05675.1 hypothetical protein AUTU_31580 [Aureibacter tunicatorum]